MEAHRLRMSFVRGPAQTGPRPFHDSSLRFVLTQDERIWKHVPWSLRRRLIIRSFATIGRAAPRPILLCASTTDDFNCSLRCNFYGTRHWDGTFQFSVSAYAGSNTSRGQGTGIWISFKARTTLWSRFLRSVTGTLYLTFGPRSSIWSSWSASLSLFYLHRYVQIFFTFNLVPLLFHHPLAAGKRMSDVYSN